MDALLTTTNLTVRFGDFVAVRDVTMKVEGNGVHAVIGPNGAGKTSLFNAISGFVKRTKGRVHLGGQDVSSAGPSDLARLGLARSFQICSIFPHLSVLDNVRMALMRKTKGFRLLSSRVPRDALEQEAATYLSHAGLSPEARRSAGELSYGRRRMLELVTTIALKPRLLLLDEPTSGLAREDIAPVVDLIRATADKCGILIVEHNLGVVESLATKVTVLAEGSVLCEGSYREVAADQRVQTAYIGDDRDA